jgi:NADH-quinone oxidoreductase subunit C
MTDDKTQRLMDAVAAALGEDALALDAPLGEVSVRVPRAHVAGALERLRDDPDVAMTMLLDLCGVDYPERSLRFEIVYHLTSLTHRWSLRVRVAAGEGDSVPSVVSVWPTAGWFEREAWDMFGVPFAGHPDLRRLLTDYGFSGHPLRKDFPLSGRVEARYDLLQRRIVTEPVSLPQDYRAFATESPWAGMTDVQKRGRS